VLKIASLVYTIAGATGMGMLIVVALVLGYDTKEYMIMAAALGAVLAMPVSYFIAKAISEF